MKKIISKTQTTLLLFTLLIASLPTAFLAEENMTTTSSSVIDGTSTSSSMVREEPADNSSSSLVEPRDSTSLSTEPTVQVGLSDTNTVAEEPIESSVGLEEETKTREQTQNESIRAVYRLFHPIFSVHLYTMDTNEYSILATKGWRQEGLAWHSSEHQGEIVYRLYNPTLSTHLYTKNLNEYNTLTHHGWRQEGKAFYSFGEVPIYRLYNPYLRRHLYTKNTKEYASLVHHGWRQEGISFYSVSDNTGQNPALPKENPIEVKGDIELVSEKTGELTVSVKNVYSSSPIKQVKMAVWSKEAGQDDKKWYDLQPQENGQYQLTVLAKEHANSYGKYQFILYYVVESGEMYGVQSFQTDMRAPKSTGQIHIERYDDQKGTFDIVVTGVSAPQEITSILIPVWSDVNGQDDLNWYTAQKSSDGKYRVSVQAQNHKYSIGDYHIHLYYKLANGEQPMIAATKQFVSIKQTKPEGKIQIQQVDHNRGSFDVVVSQLYVPTGISKIEVPVWSDKGGQDDIRWYTATRRSDGTYHLTVKIADHGYQAGKYHIHAYVTPLNQSRLGIGATSVDIHYKGPQYNGNYYSVQGKYGEIPIVNKKYAVNRQYAPGENPSAKAAFNRLTNQMRTLGFGISYSYSGFRSYETQNRLYWNYVNLHGQVAADRFSARPGHSEHQTGLAFDVIGTGGGLLSQPNAVAWLASHAHEYGFIVRYQAGKEHITGYMAEAWHIRYIGNEATEIYRSGLSLEEYLGVEGGDYRR
ncbi:LD-carboxypeptidase LdcB/DacB [Streptococcus cameli]